MTVIPSTLKKLDVLDETRETERNTKDDMKTLALEVLFSCLQISRDPIF